MADITFEVDSKDYRLRFSAPGITPGFYEAFWMDGGSEKATRISENLLKNPKSAGKKY